MSGDRCLAMCMPFKYHRVVTATRVKFLAVALWITSVGFSLLFLAWTKPDGSESTECDYMGMVGEVGFKCLAIVYIGIILIKCRFLC